MKLSAAALPAVAVLAGTMRAAAGASLRTQKLILQSRRSTFGGLPSKAGAGWGAGYFTPAKYFDQLKQVKRSMPPGSAYWGYDASPPGAGGDYGDAPPGTTFDTKLAACRACETFYPSKKDGLKFHDAVYKDPKGGEWDQVCRVGPCNFRDPQTQPWGGEAGSGSEAFQVASMTEWGSGWRGPKGKLCFTLDPVSWYEDCEPLLKADVKNAYDLSRFCSYKTQMFVPPAEGKLSPFAGVDHKSKWEAFTRLDSSREQCLETIATNGPALWNNVSMCDSNVGKLSGCCESVFDSFKCMIMKGRELNVDVADVEGLNATKTAMAQGLQLFKTYCVPLCEYSRPEYCQVYPVSDVCVNYGSCVECIEHGGHWINEACVCAPPGTPASICPAPPPAPPTPPPPSLAPAPPPPPPPAVIEPKCKYLEMADVWSQEPDFKYR